MGSFGALEIAIIVLVVLLFFGAKRIPELARGLGQGIQEFRKASDDIKKEIDKSKDDVREAASVKAPREETDSVKATKEKETENK